MHANENLLNPKEGETTPLGNNRHAFKRQRCNRVTNLKSNGTVNIHLDATTNYLPLEVIIENVIKDDDQTVEHSSHYIPSTGDGSHPDQYTKPTPQPEKTVRHRPTAADKKIKKIVADGKPIGHSASNDIVDTKYQ
jgi:hypothetical protein